jgi:hypothetical protein
MDLTMPSMTLILAIAALGGVPGKTDGGETPNGDHSQIITSWLDGVLASLPVKIRPQKVVPIEDDNVQNIFPGERFYSVSFATWPIAPRLPKEISYETLVRVRQGSIEPVRDLEALKGFLAKSLSGIADKERAAVAGLASLRLAEAIATAGLSAFEKPEVSVVQHGSDIAATARAVAAEPARGEVQLDLEFGPDGKVKPDSIQITDRSRRGPPGRP